LVEFEANSFNTIGVKTMRVIDEDKHVPRILLTKAIALANGHIGISKAINVIMQAS